MRLNLTNKSVFTLFVLLAVFILGLIIYINTFWSDFTFDDNTRLVNNPAIRDINIKSLFSTFRYRLITGFTFALNYKLDGLNVFGYHLFNFAIHILASIFVYYLVRLTLRTPLMQDTIFSKNSDIIACFSCLIFLTHPIQTQAVSYIWQRSTSLATLFYLTTVVLYINGRLKSRPIYFLMAFIFMLIGMLTKSIAGTIPLTLFFYEFTFFGSFKKKPMQRLLVLFPFLIILLLTLFIMLHGKSFHFSKIIYIKTKMSKIPRRIYLLTQFNVIRTYIRLLFLPILQNLDYDYPLAKKFFEIKTFFSFSMILGILASAVCFFKKYRLLSFCIFWFFITISIESFAAVLPDVIFEHRLYLPMVGFALFLPASLRLLLKDNKKYIATLSVIVIIFSIFTYNRNNLWKDDLALWRDVAGKSPNKARPWHNLGFAHEKKGNYDKAIEYYQKAIKMYSKRAKIYKATAYKNIGVVYIQKGNYGKAIEYYQKAVKLWPDYTMAYENLGSAYCAIGNYDKAIESYWRAILCDSKYAIAYVNLGVAYALKGNKAGAQAQATKLRELNENDLAELLNSKIKAMF